MAKINLDFSTKRALGKYLPSVMINTIAIENRGAEGPDPSTGSSYGHATDLIITANLIINITKPKDMQDPAAWIKEYLGGLYLYAYINSVETLNEQLENKNLSLRDLQSALRPQIRETFSSNSYGFDIIHEYMRDSFLAREWKDWLGDSGDPIYDAYADADESTLAAGMNDPGCVWHYIFYGNHGTTGPWWGPDGWYVPATGNTGDLDSEKILYSDISHGTEETYKFESGDVKRSFMKNFIMQYLYFLGGTHPSMSESESYSVNMLARKIALRDILTDGEPNPYGANFFIQNVYDQEGNELIQISNINVSFEYGMKYSHDLDDDGILDYSLMEQRLKNSDKVFFIGTIGVDTDMFDFTLGETPRSIYNSYFGNISYEHILQNNNVPTQYVETFHISNTGAPYDEIPLVNLDGRYHVVEPVNHDTIISQIQSLIKVYEHRKKDQYSLKRNIETLEGIIETYKTSPSILRLLSAYHQSYSPQDASRPAGWFFNDFSNLLSNLSKRVGYQPRLDKRLSRVGIVTDYRAMAINEIYYAPTPKWGDYPTLLWDIGTEGNGSDDFIPSKWARMSRMTLMADIGAGTDFLGFGSDNEQFRQDVWDDILNSGDVSAWLAAGFTMADIETWVEATTAQATLREGGAWIDGDTPSAAIDDMHDPFGLARLKDYDYIVKNSGHFWFDWEKALYTQSNIAQVLQLNKLGRFFRMRVPYKYYPLLECKMTREELNLSLREDGDLGIDDWLDNRRTVILKTVLSGDLPASAGQELSYEVSPISDTSDYAYGFPQKQVSCLRPLGDASDPGAGVYGEDEAGYLDAAPGIYAKSGGGAQGEGHLEGDHISLTTKTEQSYLKFVVADSAVNFSGRMNANAGDTEHAAARDSLIGYGLAPPGVSGSTGYSATPHDSALPLGYRVRNGYRLMGFEYTDLMDDDVAFYNTMAYAASDRFPNRQEALETLNSLGQTNSEYKIEIKVKDKSLGFYTDVFWPFIRDSYNDFYEYYLFAEEFCSFNNLNGQFNKFFVDAINERYAESSEKRWVRGALVATLLKEILYRSFEHAGPASEELMRDLMETEVMKIINNISPEEGNLQALRMFNCRFGKYLLQVNPHADFFREFCAETENSEVYERAIEISGLAEDELDHGATDWDKLRDVEATHNFINYLQIDSVIYGDYLLNAQLEDDVTFGMSGIHPLGIPPAHLYLTSGNPTSPDGGYSNTSSRILVYAHGSVGESGTEGFCSVPSSIIKATDIPGGYLQSGWYYLENLVNVDSDLYKLIEGGADAISHGLSGDTLSKKITTPLLMDLGQASITSSGTGETFDYANAITFPDGTSAEERRFTIEGHIDTHLSLGGTTMFTAEMFKYVCGVGSVHAELFGSGDMEAHTASEYGRFTFCIVSTKTINMYYDRAGSLYPYVIPDPTPDQKHLRLSPFDLDALKGHSLTISLADLIMGDDASDIDMAISGWETASVSDLISADGLWFPNWSNLNIDAYGAHPTLPRMRLGDWRLYRPSFGPDPSFATVYEAEATAPVIP